MADEKIVIKIDVDARTTAIEKTTQAVKRLKREAGKFSSGKKDVNSYLKEMNNISNNTNKLKRHFDTVDKGIKAFGFGLKKFVTYSLKGVVAEMAILGAAMLGIHALFIAGRGLAKAYSGAMQIMAGGAAAAAVALATAAAAIREQQAAMFAYRGKGAAEFGSGLNQARVAMRALQMDADLAGLGVANLNKAYAAMSKSMSTPQINASTALFKSLMDFGSAGQDPGKAAEAVGTMIASLSDSKKSLGDVKTAAKALGPEMETALKKANVKTKDQLKQLIMSGELAKLGGVAGQFGAVNNTLIGQAKIFFNLLKGQFADFGQVFLEPAKNAMQRVFKIIQRDVNILTGTFQSFGKDSVFEGIVSVIDKTSSWAVRMIQEYLPKAEGMAGRIGRWWNSFSHGWKRFVDMMRPFIDGARVIEDAFRPIWKALKEGTYNFKYFNELLVNNRDDVIEFGTRVGDLIRAVANFSVQMKEAFFGILPVINDILSGVKQFFNLMAGGLGKFGGLMSMIPLMAYFVGGRTMSQTKGGFLPSSVTSMNVRAGNVTVTGPGVGGPVPGTPGAGTSGPAATSRRPYTKRRTGGGGNTLYGPPAYTNQGQALYSPTGKLVGRDPVTGRFTKLTPGDRGNNVAVGGPSYLPTAAGAGTSAGAAGAALASGRAGGRITFAKAARMTSAQRGGLTPRQYVAAMNPKVTGALPTTASALSGPTAIASPSLLSRMAAPATGPLSPGYTPSGFRNFRMRVRAARSESVFGANLFGNERLGIKGINNSATARMGVGLGLGMLSQAAPEEMRGALALGGTVGMFNPLAGLAVGLGGAAMNARGAGTGALAGAGAGAAIGSYFGPYGAAIGAGIGLIGGAIRGAINGVVMRAKEARKAIGDATDALFKGSLDSAKAAMQANNRLIAQGQSTEGVRGAYQGAGMRFVKQYQRYNRIAERGLRRAKAQNIDFLSDKQATTTIDELERAGFALTDDQMKKAKKAPKEALKEIIKTAKVREEVYKQIDYVNDKRLDALMKQTGKTTPELEKLANELGVDLYDATKSYSQLVNDLGLNIVRTSQQIKDANQSIIVSGLSMFDEAIKQAEAPKIMDERARVISDQLDAGSAASEDILKYLQGAIMDFNSLNMGDPVAGFFDMIQSIGVGGKAYQPGGIFAGREAQLAQNPVFQNYINTTRKNLVGDAAVDINAMLGATGEGYAIDARQLQNRITELSPEQQERFLRDLQAGKISFDPKSSAAAGMGIDAVVQSVLSTYGFKGLSVSQIQDDPLNVVADEFKKGTDEFKAAVESFVTQMDAVFKKYIGEGDGDTRSPRRGAYGDTVSSRLSQTMARHSAMNSQLTGNRFITSAFRTTNLGSPSSDHAAGAAYDLVGQNLGRYSKLVHANGGFAEFHGVNGQRHLHVVPGPGPYGDSSTPSFSRVQKAAVDSGSRGVSNVVVNVYPSAGMSEEALAQKVIQKIRTNERSNSERY